jgi:hypothetical protein
MIWMLMIGLFVGASVTAGVFVGALVYGNKSKQWSVSKRVPEVETRFRQRTAGSDLPPARVTTARVRPVSRRRGRF